MNEIVEQVIEPVRAVISHLANDKEGQAMMDDIAAIIVRFYTLLVEGGIPPEAASVIVSGLWRMKT